VRGNAIIMQLTELVEVSQLVASTRSRLEKIATLTAWLKRLPPAEIEIGVRYLSGETRQSKLGVGPATIVQARAKSATHPALSLTDVDTALAEIAGASGKGAASERKRILGQLFAQANAAEQDFLIRLLFGELRQGALLGIMQDALAQAAQVSGAQLRRASMVAGGLAAVAPAALTEGDAGLQRFRLRVFQPVLPMLAQPSEDVEDALRQLGIAALEWKLDGARIQVHKSGDEVRIFSRGLNDVTLAVPEIVELIHGLPAATLILDGEAIALRPDGRPHPFQTTMRRFGRRLDVASLRATLPLSALFFDVLRVDDCELLDRGTAERFEALARALPSDAIVPRLVTGDAAAAQAFLNDALARGHEGIMAKALDALYEAGSRGSSWLKVKQAHTLDLVIIAAEWGHGRRHGWLSNLHLGARDPASGEFVMLGKTFKGLTDQMLEWQTRKLLEIEVSRDAGTIYVRPEIVVEIALNEIQESPQYPAGLALRFARVKGYRSDKRPDEVDTVETVRKLFASHGGRRSS
jgi:ATP-dependent DNA ligase I